MLTIENLWKESGFRPNENQEEAIRHLDGPLFLTAGPGSGKTRVLLWRTLNLIVFHGVKPEEIFLSTFTEKAALQLREGLKSLLAVVTNKTGQPFDLAKMALGTVHSICRQILSDRRFSLQARRPKTPSLLDELGQYFYLYNSRRWSELVKAGGFESVEAANLQINMFLEGRRLSSRHSAVSNTISLFNRLSEECLDPSEAKKKTRDQMVRRFLDMYNHYLDDLSLRNGSFGAVDFSLLQQKALDVLINYEQSESVFKHLIIDEYQDTNSIQERLFFKLAKGLKNICIVGDDDQALYRFRGATVENLVEFESRCKQFLGAKPKRIDLDVNYRSREPIVSFYTDFIGRCDWKKKGGGYHRVHDKNIAAYRKEKKASVIASSAAEPQDVYSEIVSLVKKLIKKKKVQDPNQIAFLFPSLKNNSKVTGLKDALEDAGLKVYAPRASRFLDLDESRVVFGLFMLILGKPKSDGPPTRGLKDFHIWMKGCSDYASEIVDEDKQLSQFIDDRQLEITRIESDYRGLLKLVEKNRWSLDAEFRSDMVAKLTDAQGLSAEARKTLMGPYLRRVIEQKKLSGQPYPLKYIISRVTSLDWNILDLFYQLNGFEYFKTAYDAAEKRKDEGPLCNLGIISQYLSRFMEQFASIITAGYLEDQKFQKQFFRSYVYALYRRQESEFEDADDPFPKGRIPFLTIHQAKGLEFPVVILGSPRKREWPASQVEMIARKLTGKKGEPLERIGEFDNMRMFYVALSRSKNLLVIPHYKGTGQVTSPPFKEMLEEEITRIPDFDLDSIPPPKEDEQEIGKNYSYTGDYLIYRKCPRQYMVFKTYGFVPSRSQTMFFGSVVHQTIEDLHHLFLRNRP